MNIPPEIQEFVESALSRKVRLQPLSGGRSGALLYSVETDCGKYVARLLSPQARKEEGKAQREMACMRIAAEAGVGPNVVAGSEGIILMEWLEGAPISRGTPRETKPLARLAATLRQLHAAPAFPAGPSVKEMHDGLDGALRRTCGAALPEAVGATISAAGEELASFGRRASCHRDLNPTNILASSDGVFLVDWEVAGLGDPFIDLAQVGIWICRHQGEREELLENYLKRTPDSNERQRLALARLLALAFYSASFHFLCALQKVTPAGEAPTLEELFAHMASTGQSFETSVMAGSLLREMHGQATQLLS